MSGTSEATPQKEEQVKKIPLEKLFLDPKNPRFGSNDAETNQIEILDKIVEFFGIEDVLSSISVNGYFEAEPLVCRAETDGSFTVVEGNRRLAACLIITNNSRAIHQDSRIKQYNKIWKEHDCPPIDPVPSIVFAKNTNSKEILSYLGVRHIASSQPWDSYAKAAWVAKVVDENGLQIQDVAQMIGDKHRTVNRLLEGYYLVKQLNDTGNFDPKDSQRKGRGSVTEYPFSWVYTILGYSTVRSYLNLPEGDANKAPLSPENLGRGRLLLHAMFGNKSKGRSAAIDDSRQLGSLAAIVSDPAKIHLLEAGKNAEEIILSTKPIIERLSIGLLSVRDILKDLVSGLAENDVTSEQIVELLSISANNRKLSIELDRKLRDIVTGDIEDE